MPTVADIASAITADDRQQRLLVAVDGADASGKTTFAARLASALTDLGRTALVIHADDFMHVCAVRHRRGRESAEGYLDDSFDYEALTRDVLAPLCSTGSGDYRPASVDRHRDVRITPPVQHAPPSTITIVEGIFLLRTELAHWWDYSVFLDVPIEVAMTRKSQRDDVVLEPGAPLTRRYVDGQRAYHRRHRPSSGRRGWCAPTPRLRRHAMSAPRTPLRAHGTVRAVVPPMPRWLLAPVCLSPVSRPRSPDPAG